MIRRLKGRFILSVMCAVIVVLGTIITAINFANYKSINESVDYKMELLAENGGKIPDDFFYPEPGDVSVDISEIMSPEMPYEIRFFTVKFDTSGEVTLVNTAKIAAVSDYDAIGIASALNNEGRDDSYYGPYKYKRVANSDGVMYIFLDCTRELRAFESFLLASVAFSVLGVISVFLIVAVASGLILKPIIESYEKQKRFITDAGHEMKTPLAIISANAEVIEMESGESQWTEGIKNQASRLATLTEKLVILSKMEEGDIKLTMGNFSLSEAFFEQCEQYKSQAVSKNVRFDVNVSENVTCHGNAGEIGRFISLMLDNAFRYCNVGGYVRVEVQKLPTFIEMRFENSTDGVEKGNLDIWFERFYRRDKSRNSGTGGSGIGLSVAKAIVKAHGGHIHAFSDDGERVVFVAKIQYH